MDHRIRTTMSTLSNIIDHNAVTLRTAINYKVRIDITRKTQVSLTFNVAPTFRVLDEVLRHQRESIPQALDERDEPAYLQDAERLDNLMALVDLAALHGKLRLPPVGKVETHEVKVAGIDIGRITVSAVEAWTIRERL